MKKVLFNSFLNVFDRIQPCKRMRQHAFAGQNTQHPGTYWLCVLFHKGPGKQSFVPPPPQFQNLWLGVYECWHRIIICDNFRKKLILLNSLINYVVYFDQHLDAAHSKGWLKYTLKRFFNQKSWKRKKKQNLEKIGFLSLHPDAVQGFYSQKKNFL